MVSTNIILLQIELVFKITKKCNAILNTNIQKCFIEKHLFLNLNKTQMFFIFIISLIIMANNIILH